MQPRDIGRAWRRLAMMLGFSMLLHAWLMHGYYGKGSARGSAGGASIAARVLPAVTEANISASATAINGDVGPKVPVFIAVDSAAAPVLATAATTTAALPQPDDPTYYAAGDLDVFPKALVKPDLSAALTTNHEPAAGAVRATLLIDEAGVVNAVRGVAAPTGEIETVARELLLRTRFTPARNKDGRIVKAQVLVALDYDTRAVPRLR